MNTKANIGQSPAIQDLIMLQPLPEGVLRRGSILARYRYQERTSNLGASDAIRETQCSASVNELLHFFVAIGREVLSV
jgi:hypothetical protein